MVGALFFGRLSDQLGRKRLLIVTLLLYLLGTGLAAFTTGHHTGLAALLLRDPLHRRMGHRRPVRGDQLGDRRDDAVEVPGPGRHLDQRLLLGGRDPRLVRLADLPQRLRHQRRLAPGLPDGPRARDRRDHRRPDPAGEPALADDPRAHGGGRAGAREDRGGRPASSGQTLEQVDDAGRPRARPREAVRLPHVPAAWCSASTRSGRSSARR